MPQIHGLTGNNIAGVTGTLGALRTECVPMEVSGEYRWAGVTGALSALAGNAEIFQFRWTDPACLALIGFLRIRSTLTTAFATAQEMIHEVITATGYGYPATGGVQILPNAINLMKRSSFPSSRVNEIRFATSAALSAGSKTLSSAPVAIQHGWAGVQGQTVIDMIVEFTNGGQEYPLVLSQNEGLIIRNGSVAMGAAGAVRMSVEIGWREVLSADFPSF